MPWKDANNKVVVLLLAVLVTFGLILIILASLSNDSLPVVGSPDSSQTIQEMQAATEAEKEVATQDLAANYQAKSTEIISSYLQQRSAILANDQDESKWLALATQTKNQLLDLKLPAKYQGLHLDLVITFNILEQGLQGDSDRVDEANARLDQILTDNPWLKGEAK
ncbi:MAG: hypothetical protein WC480_02435 [Patescibacteria group bacterium]